MPLKSTLSQIALVGCGGFIGSVLRFIATGLAQRLIPASTFPIGTLLVNTLGCLAIGYLGGLADFRQALGPSGKLFLMIGLLGGFTTFSSFAYETLLQAQDTQILKSLANIAFQVILGLLAAWLGQQAAQYTL